MLPVCPWIYCLPSRGLAVKSLRRRPGKGIRVEVRVPGAVGAVAEAVTEAGVGAHSSRLPWAVRMAMRRGLQLLTVALQLRRSLFQLLLMASLTAAAMKAAAAKIAAAAVATLLSRVAAHHHQLPTELFIRRANQHTADSPWYFTLCAALCAHVCDKTSQPQLKIFALHVYDVL